MREFELPFLQAETELNDVFGPMIEAGVSGVVIRTEHGYRLLHFAQLKEAFDKGLQTVGQVVGVDLPASEVLNETTQTLAVGSGETGVKSIQFAPGSEYCFLNADFGSGIASVCSRHEFGAGMYLATSPGYGCDKTPKHYYPPNKRGTSNDCVVFGCLGHIP